MLKLHNASHRIDMIFVLALFTIFAATAFLAVLIGARQYQTTADNMNYNYEVRTASSYLEEKIRQNDTVAGIAVTSMAPGMDAIALYSSENGVDYTTYIYCYDGWLRELFVTQDSVYSPSSGQEILELSALSAEFAGEDLLKVTFSGTDGVHYPVYLSIHSDSGKEAP
ncbi:MAG: DUF4860 domain-containing protein [Lachnospiraceae bacterium]|nr:DUF4860 domain-containing protein [Lachnospiraceae bacterium]